MEDNTPFDSFVMSANQVFQEHGTMSQEQFKTLLRQFEGQSLYLARKEITQKEIEAHARRLFISGIPRSEMKKRLCETHNISKSQAYNYIDKILNAHPLGMLNECA